MRNSSGYFYAYFAALVVICCTEVQVSAIRCYTNNLNNWTALPNNNLTEVECGPLEQCAAIKYHVRKNIKYCGVIFGSLLMNCFRVGSTDLFSS